MVSLSRVILECPEGPQMVALGTTPQTCTGCALRLRLPPCASRSAVSTHAPMGSFWSLKPTPWGANLLLVEQEVLKSQCRVAYSQP